MASGLCLASREHSSKHPLRPVTARGALPSGPNPGIRRLRSAQSRRQSSDLWPMFALRAEPSGNEWLYRLYDDEAVYYLSGKDEPTDEVPF